MNKKFFRTFAGFLLILWLVIGLQARIAPAGISVAPLKQELSLRPGEEGKVSITLNYNSRSPLDAPQGATLSIMDVQASEDGNLFFREAGALKNSASKWVTLQDAAVTLEPGKAQVVECRVTPPLNAAPGEYYTTIMVTLGTRGRTDKGLQIQYRIASGLFVTVTGRSFPKEARIVRSELIWPSTESIAAAAQPGGAPATEPAAATQPADQPAAPDAPSVPTVRVLLENTGQARFDAAGKLSIIDDRFRTVFTAPLNSRRPCIFGGDRRLFEAPITRALEAGHYTLRVEMDYQSSWAKARQDLRVDILPEQAAIFDLVKKQQAAQLSLLDATPDKISALLPAGATRNLTLTVKNSSDGPLQCKGIAAAENPLADSWFSLRPQEFTLPKGGRRTLELRVQVPPDARGDKYGSIITVTARPQVSGTPAAAANDASAQSQLSVPVEIQVKSEKQHD